MFPLTCEELWALTVNGYLIRALLYKILRFKRAVAVNVMLNAYPAQVPVIQARLSPFG